MAGEAPLAARAHTSNETPEPRGGPALFGLVDGEVELLDGLDQWESGLAQFALETGLGAVGDFLEGCGGQEFVEGSVLAFGTREDRGVGSAELGKRWRSKRTVSSSGAP